MTTLTESGIMLYIWERGHYTVFDCIL